MVWRCCPVLSAGFSVVFPLSLCFPFALTHLLPPTTWIRVGGLAWKSYWPWGVAAGADLVEIFVERNDQLNVLAEQERITSVSPAMGCGAGIRVFKGNCDGFAATNDLSEPALLTALEQALGMLGLSRSTGATGVSGWQGLTAFRDYGSGKEQWLQNCPTVPDSAERLRAATAALAHHGRHLQARRASYARELARGAGGRQRWYLCP